MLKAMERRKAEDEVKKNQQVVMTQEMFDILTRSNNLPLGKSLSRACYLSLLALLLMLVLDVNISNPNVIFNFLN
jgi:hypothetical protein